MDSDENYSSIVTNQSSGYNDTGTPEPSLTADVSGGGVTSPYDHTPLDPGTDKYYKIRTIYKGENYSNQTPEFHDFTMAVIENMAKLQWYSQSKYI